MRAQLRALRYALPGQIGPRLPAPDPLRIAARLRRNGLAVTLGYFQSEDAQPHDIAAAYAGLPLEREDGVYLSVKAPPLRFDAALLDQIGATGRDLMLDAHAPKDADRTLALAERRPGTGVVLPARWRRSLADAARFRDTDARIRVVKGEWADPGGGEGDYLELVAALAGRRAPVSVATHHPALAAGALDILRAAGTPCELEQLRGLPRRRTIAAARARSVPVRVYVPFGPGWWPYAIDKALARPHLPLWYLRDRFGA